MNLKYKMIIQWSEEENIYLVALPDFPGKQWATHGKTYEQAVTFVGFYYRSTQPTRRAIKLRYKYY